MRMTSTQPLPAVQGSPFGEEEKQIIFGKDQRVEVLSKTALPYKWICYLLITDASGTMYIGSGFKIYLPDVNRTAVVTSGHCTYVNGAYATKIIVQFPGQQAVAVGKDDIYASPEYTENRKDSADHDYGLILLPGSSKDGFGWSTILLGRELNNRVVTNCGYPGDKPKETLWITGGPIKEYTANRIYYMNDTMGGQSGSPVYTWYGGYWTVLAVHSYGGRRGNSAPRFTRKMIFRFLERMNGVKSKSLRSVQFPNVYVRCNGTGVDKPDPAGGGTVNCQYKPPSDWEKFYIYPVAMAPSLAPKTTYKVAIESAQFRDVFIRMNSKGMSQPMDNGGGGEVNCQFNTISSWESYFLRQEGKGIYSFRSVQFPHCFIRLDGTGVKSVTANGGGTVNCQYYYNPWAPVPASSWEIFYVEEH